MNKVVLIGDSIRMYYQETVRTELEGSAEVIAPEDNGGTSSNVLAHLDAWITTHRPDLVHLNCGLHDIKRVDGRPPVTALQEYASNVEQIFRGILAGGSALIWATTTPVNEQWHHERKEFDRWEADVAAYNEAALEVARRLDVPVNDLFAVVMAAGRDELLSPDGVHFTDEGSAMLGRTVANVIRAHLA